MAAYYTYLITTLPTLNFASQPPFSFNLFLERCRELTPRANTEFLSKLSLSAQPLPQDVSSGLLKKWYAFDLTLRNELVKIRAARRKTDPKKYLRPDGFGDPAAYQMAMSAQRSTSLLESERILDRYRWAFLEELNTGHYFDFEVLIIYALKLLLLEKWLRIQGADKSRVMEGLFKEG